MDSANFGNLQDFAELERAIRWAFENSMKGISVDCVVFGFHDNQLRVLCLKVKGSDIWSLPGGHIQLNESVDEAAYRILKYRTGLDHIYLKQFYTFGEVNRANVRAMVAGLKLPFPPEYFETRAVSVGYYALVEYSKVRPVLDFMSDDIQWIEPDKLPSMIFDHHEIVATGLKSLRAQIDHLPIVYHLMPDTFTMPELQKLHEAILGEELDRANFQKRILSYNILERLEERRTGGAHKAPFLYRFIPEKYQEFLRSEF
jgi:8-oxo-dGTP diphosphatase